MAEGGKRGLLSIGTFLIILVIVVVIYAAGLIEFSVFVPLLLVLTGIWTIALAGIRTVNPQKYERSAFSTLLWGLLMTAFGGSWFLYIYTSNVLYSLASILLVLGVLALASALRRK